MAKRRTHMAMGATAGALAYILQNPLPGGEMSKEERDAWWLNAVASAVGGAIGGYLPDMLEPATSPNHREFFHSVTAGVLLHRVMPRNTDTPGTVLLKAIILGYFSHLTLDALTPKGLPLI